MNDYFYNKHEYEEMITYNECINLIKLDPQNLSFIPNEYKCHELYNIALDIDIESFQKIELSRRSLMLCKKYLSLSSNIKNNLLDLIPYELHIDEIYKICISKNHEILKEIKNDKLNPNIICYYLSLESDISIFQKLDITPYLLEESFWKNNIKKVSDKIKTHPNFPEHLKMAIKTFNKESYND